MARTSTARKQRRKTKAKARKVLRPRAAAASIEVPDPKRTHDARATSRFKRARGAEAADAGPADIEHDETRLSGHVDRRATIQAPNLPAGDESRHQQIRSSSDVVYNHAMGTGMQALQLLIALPFLSLQIWQRALLGPLQR